MMVMLGLDPQPSLSLFSDWLTILRGKATECIVLSQNPGHDAQFSHRYILDPVFAILLCYSQTPF